jgi:KDO2-lipid IV(A) lauroyltransferase
LARWRIEVGDEIPTRENGRARSVETIMGAVNDAFEAAIRRDPANWFWVHRRWKPERLRQAREQRNPEACDRIRNP